MRVMIIRNAFSYDFGGAERLAVYIARELGLHAITAMVVSCQPRLLAFAEAEGVKTKRGLWWSKQNWSGPSILLLPAYIVWQLILTFWYIVTIFQLRPDVLHILSKDDFIAGTLAAKLLRKGVVWTDCADLKFIFQNHKTWYKNPVGKLVYVVSTFADSVTLVSKNEKRLIEEQLGKPLPVHFVVVYSVGRDEPVMPVKRNEPDDVVVFCATSRLVIAKGIGELIEAFNSLSSDTERYRLWIAGDGPDADIFRKSGRSNPHIIFLGHLDNPLEYLATADVYVHPTHHEGFSLSLAEAAMLGKPLIATDVGGNPELVNSHNGILIPVQNIKALIAAMKRLGEDKNLRERFGKRAREDFLAKIDFAKIITEEYIPIYEKATKN